MFTDLGNLGVTGLRSAWVWSSENLDTGAYHVFLFPNEANEEHETLCGITLRERYPAFLSTLDPSEPDLCLNCAARAALVLAGRTKT